MPRRGTTTERGCGRSHRARRAKLEAKVARGRVRCWRCGKRILRGQAWDLGHDDTKRTAYRGPEHATCNRSAARQRQLARQAELRARRAAVPDEPLEAGEW